MCPCKTRKMFGKTVFDKQGFTCWLVFIARLNEFISMDNLSDVVCGSTKKHCLFVILKARPILI